MPVNAHSHSFRLIFSTSPFLRNLYRLMHASCIIYIQIMLSISLFVWPFIELLPTPRVPDGIMVQMLQMLHDVRAQWIHHD